MVLLKNYCKKFLKTYSFTILATIHGLAYGKYIDLLNSCCVRFMFKIEATKQKQKNYETGYLGKNFFY